MGTRCDGFPCAKFSQSVDFLASGMVIVHAKTGARWKEQGINPVSVFPAMFDMDGFREGLFLERKFFLVVLPVGFPFLSRPVFRRVCVNMVERFGVAGIASNAGKLFNLVCNTLLNQTT
ncbi:hypothetical protein MSKU9_2111 [Komagataeibacter diospyri]|uniref:Uncharacterized protein n=1 Tax=Komagataeibacter diospyri TaxID=1932662 RepID=A0A4P5NQQ1_9PROT|nr:hypothetical protein MSKU9_2111 [Komagataeibacter diospyri]